MKKTVKKTLMQHLAGAAVEGGEPRLQRLTDGGAVRKRLHQQFPGVHMLHGAAIGAVRPEGPKSAAMTSRCVCFSHNAVSFG